MANILTSRNLIIEETGETNLWVLKGMARRRAIAEYGSLSPYALRLSLHYYGDLIAELSADWRYRHSLPVASTTITPHGKHHDGVRRSAF
jgi:hypothetical protein